MSALALLAMILGMFFGHSPAHQSSVRVQLCASASASRDASGHVQLTYQVTPCPTQRPAHHSMGRAARPATLTAYVTSPGQGRPGYRPQPIIYRLQLGEGFPTVAERYGVTIAAIDAANPWVANPNTLPVGYPVIVPPAGWTPNQGETGRDQRGETPTGNPAPGSYAASGWVAVPGMPDSLSMCVEERESSDNPRAVNSIPGYIGQGGGLFGIMPYTWHDLGYSGEPYNAPVSEQVTAASTLYREDGMQPWAPSDGCGR